MHDDDVRAALRARIMTFARGCDEAGAAQVLEEARLGRAPGPAARAGGWALLEDS
jgi:hypothetical protein